MKIRHKELLLAFVCLIAVAICSGQIDTTSKKETDSLLAKLLLDLPKSGQADFINEFKKMSIEERKSLVEMMEYFSSVPRSSKKQLIQNVDTNYNNIRAAQNFFKKIIPKEYSIYIEFKPPDKYLKLAESVDFWVEKANNPGEGSKQVFREWDVELRSKKFDSLLSLTPFSRDEIQQLKIYLDKANCISISNMDKNEIGFARSGMGKYSYMIFEKPLTNEEIKKFNDGCTYIFHKNNIVLVYGGGAVGPQCFPDND